MGDSEEKTLDDVINCCVERYELEVNDENRDKYMRFLERQKAAHPDYDLNLPGFNVSEKTYPYIRLMVNKLMLFSYLTGETPIIAGRVGNTEERRIKSVNDLYLLRPSEFGIGNYMMRRTDKRLITLLSSIVKCNNLYLKFGFPNWSMTVDELGRDEEVVRHLGMEIDTEIIKNCHSPYKNDLKQ